MFSTILSAAVLGIDAYPVQVEADICDGLPQFSMVGDLAAEVKEAADRVRTALRNNGIAFPAKKVTVNLSPAHIRKEGTRFDLPVAVALLTALGIIPREHTEEILMVGEIGLNGLVRPVSGVLQSVMLAKERGYTACLVPAANVREAASVPGILVIGIQNLQELLECLVSEGIPERYIRKEEFLPEQDVEYQEDFRDVNGQEGVRRAAEIVAAGMHNFLMIGSPGAGKTMIARRIPTILPRLTVEESLEISRVYSACGLLVGEGLAKIRPFRAPHHTISANALAGGGRKILPGEISLATHGVLFLDELPEFSRSALEVLRQPMEEGQVTISRANGKYVFPAHFVLISAMNPCPCGYYPDRDKCRCLPGEISRYLHRVSWPLLDRIDICTETPRVDYQGLTRKGENESSAQIRERVEAARKIQKRRYQGQHWQFNSRIPVSAIPEFCVLGSSEMRIMEAAFERMNLSARAYYRIIRVARTIADLEGEERIRDIHLLEALGYRSVDQNFWDR
ncbi:MAG: YifB family Mg chelatase-like AAA ATPase [Lachnospiraceae bacterium]|nr:YifB family Mg chelatase-like AAA ATPase [Lachnospiraceae bacterium]